MTDPSRAEIAVRLGTALNWFWFCCGRFREGRRRLTTAISMAAEMPALLRGRGLTALGTLAIWQGDFRVGASADGRSRRLEYFEHRDRVARERQSGILGILHAMHDRWGEFQVVGGRASRRSVIC